MGQKEHILIFSHPHSSYPVHHMVKMKVSVQASNSTEIKSPWQVYAVNFTLFFRISFFFFFRILLKLVSKELHDYIGEFIQY